MTSAPHNVSAEQLKQFTERYEQLEAEKKVPADLQKKLMAEIKGAGFDGKVFKKLIARRKRRADEIAEEEAVMEVYLSALGEGNG